MKISAKVFANLTQYLSQEFLAQYPQGIRSGSPLEVDLPEGSTLDNLVDRLSLPKDLVKITFVNGRVKELDYCLESGDVVGIFPPIAGGKMGTITVDVWLYGPLSRYGGDAAQPSFANLKVELPVGSQMCDLLKHLSMPTEERGITFINGDLSALPDFQPDLEQLLEDGDRVAFFHLRSMWPAQYRHGAALASGLAAAMKEETKFFHHRRFKSEN